MASPQVHIDVRFGNDEEPPPWSEVRDRIEAAELWWVTTVRTDGRPHVTPLLAVWHDEVLHFCTGPEEQKGRNLEANAHVALTTGVNTQDDGIDVVIEGEAVRVTDDAVLGRLADAWVAKYGEGWRYYVRDGAFFHTPESTVGDDHGPAHAFAVPADKVLAFRKGDRFSQTRYRFA